jgi:isoleucyl-tRNA synthetase
LVTLVKLLAPILPHTCDEAWDHIPFRSTDDPASVHLAFLPKYDEAVLHLATGLEVQATDNMVFSFDHLKAGPAKTWQKLLELRDQGLVKLEALRNGGVKNALDAEAIFQVASDNELAAGFVQTYLRELEDLLGVGHARMERISPATLGEGVAVNVEVADTREKYKSCARSWKRRPDVGQDAQYPDLSARDAAVMREIGK